MTRGTLRSWGRYPYHPQILHHCHWQSDLARRLDELSVFKAGVLAQGNGLSYGDSCLAASDQLVHMRALDRFIRADWELGLLVAEAGVTLAEVLALSVPNGWFLPVTPGTKHVTLGGALANDVHGKNHHVRGTFGCHVSRFGLVRSDRAPILCSRDTHPELFAATIGGLGLTGIVTWVELQLIPIRSNLIDATYFRFQALSDFFSLYRELDAHHEYTVAWIDCLAKGRRTGRGIFMAGDHAPHGKLEVPSRLEKRVPITPPISFVNHASLRLFNLVYYYGHRVKTTKKSVAYDRFFYPLDDLLDWNRLYGRRGLQQFQCVVPDSSAEAAIGDLLANIAATGTGSFLAVLKRCGDIASPGLLSFPMPGVSLALDFPHSDKLARDLLPRLDAIVRAASGRLYPAKDAHMSANDFRTSYPAYEQVEKLRDPAINSRFWKRVAQT